MRTILKKKFKIYMEIKLLKTRICQLKYQKNCDIFSSFLCTSFNSSIKTFKFLNCLKLADKTPLYKEGKNDKKENRFR